MKETECLGAGRPAHHRGIFQIALFCKGITQLPVLSPSDSKAWFRSCGVRSHMGAARGRGRGQRAEGGAGGEGQLLSTQEDPPGHT